MEKEEEGGIGLRDPLYAIDAAKMRICFVSSVCGFAEEDGVCYQRLPVNAYAFSVPLLPRLFDLHEDLSPLLPQRRQGSILSLLRGTGRRC